MWAFVAVFALATVWFGGEVLSQDEGAAEGVDAAMAKAMEAGKPGAFHKHLEPLLGSWNCAVKLSMIPGAPPEESKGTIERRWILGGRFLSEDYHGVAMGQPFSGHGLMGYDNLQNKYDTIWMDTMGTGIFTQTGSCDASGKNFEFSGTNMDPMTGQLKWGKSTVTIVNNNKNIMRMMEKGEDGTERVTLEIVSTRK
jgi:hypothetical protein